MTKREFYTAVINAQISDEMTETAQTFIDALDARTSATKAKNAEKNAPFIEKVREFFNGTSEQFVTSEIAEAVDMTVPKVNAILRKMAEDGELIQEEVKVSGKGKRKAYRKA